MLFFYHFNIRLSYFTFMWFLYPSSELSRQTNGCKTDIENRGVRRQCFETFASLNHFLICRFRVFKHILSTEKRYLKLSFESELHVGLFTVLINLCKPVNSLQMLNDFEGSKNRTHSLPSCCLFTLVVREATPMKQTMILCLDFWSNGTRRFSM